MISVTSKTTLIIIGALGWSYAGVFALLACFLAADSRASDLPLQGLVAAVLGPMLALIPGLTLVAAAHLFRGKRKGLDQESEEPIHWRWVVLLIVVALELLVLPLSVIAAITDDDSLMVTVPLNVGTVIISVMVGCVPYWRRVSIALCVIHLLGMACATMFAAINIESVVASGVFLLLTGLALAFAGTFPRRTRILFATSTVIFIVLSFLTILFGEFGPEEADGPLFAAMVAYQIAFVPIGLWVLYRALAKPSLAIRPQFGLGQLLAAMVIVCIAASTARLAFSLNRDLQIAIAAGISTLVGAGVIAVLIGAGSSKWPANAELPKSEGARAPVY